MAQEPLDNSLAVRKLFTADEIDRVRRFVEGLRRARYQPSQGAGQSIRWPEWVNAIATTGAFAFALASGVVATHPQLRLFLLVAIPVPFLFWMLLRIISLVRIRRYQHAARLDAEDMLLTDAAAVVRAAELVKEVVSPQGRRVSLGFLGNVLHGDATQRVDAELREGYSGAEAVADVILCLRPPVHSDTLNTWARALRDRVRVLHRAVVEIAGMARCLPEERRRNEEQLRLAEAAYENYREFWARFVLGSGRGVQWQYSDPLLPDGDATLPQWQYGLPAPLRC